VPIANGAATFVVGPLAIPGVANPINQAQDILLDTGAALVFLVDQKPLCAGMTGHTSSPLSYTLDPSKGDLCVLLPFAGVFPDFTDALFTSSACRGL
jgi:hypothetical protein